MLVSAAQVFGRRPFGYHYSTREYGWKAISPEGIDERREGGRHRVGAIRPGISGLRPPTRICDESPLHHGLYPSFVYVYTVLAGVSTQHAADSPPVRFGAAFSMLSSARP